MVSFAQALVAATAVVTAALIAPVEALQVDDYFRPSGLLVPMVPDNTSCVAQLGQTQDHDGIAAGRIVPAKEDQMLSRMRAKHPVGPDGLNGLDSCARVVAGFLMFKNPRSKAFSVGIAPTSRRIGLQYRTCDLDYACALCPLVGNSWAWTPRDLRVPHNQLSCIAVHKIRSTMRQVVKMRRCVGGRRAVVESSPVKEGSISYTPLMLVHCANVPLCGHQNDRDHFSATAQHARDCNAFLFTIKGVEVQAAARKGLTLTVRLRGETEGGYQLVKAYDEFKALRDTVQRNTHQWKKFNQRMGSNISIALGAREDCAYCMHFMSSVESNLWLGPLAHAVHLKQHNTSQLEAWINYYVLQARVARGGCKASDCVTSLVAEFFRTETERDTILEV